MKIFFFFFATICFLIKAVVFTECRRQDSDLTITAMISKHGYSVEVHHVTTKDDYILEMHRISKSYRKSKIRKNDKKVVFMMHELLGSSASWVISGPNRSLAFILADRGHDVWLGNNRGNTFSKKHRTKLETSYDFWDFSWHEFGIYDLPAMIDYVLRNTSQENLLYICFSQGCTQMFVMGSLKPEYNKKINFALALSPAAFFSHFGAKVKIFWPITYLAMYLSESWGYFEVLSTGSALRIFTSYFCKKGVIWQKFCMLGIFLIAGFGYDDIDQEHLADFLAYIPAGSSWKQILHYAFGYWHPGTFREFDYGSRKNLELYNSTTPPDYPLGNVDIPIAIYHGSNDYLAAPEDVDILAKRLPNVLMNHLVSERKLNHYDFILGVHVRELIYDRALKLFNNRFLTDDTS